MTALLPSIAEVVAVGARTPLGLDARQTGMLLRAGFAAMGPAPLGADGEDVTICQVDALLEGAFGAARAIELGNAAIGEALAALPDRHGADTRVTLYLGLDADADGADAIAAEIGARCRGRFRAAGLEVTVRDAGGPALAVAAACDALRERRADLCIVGGVHTDYDRSRIARLGADDRLYADDNLDAIMPGESAAFVVLASAGSGGALASIASIANGVAEARSDNQEPSAPARGATACMRRATADLERLGLRAGWVLSDIGFDGWRIREQQTVLLRHHRVLGEPYRMDNPAQRIGHMGAAAMPLCITLAAEAFTRGYAPSPLALVTAGSDGGERGALVVAAPA
jgi:3-oxoacyl-[acyl-carrier-protein] synthase I